MKNITKEGAKKLSISTQILVVLYRKVILTKIKEKFPTPIQCVITVFYRVSKNVFAE